MPDKSGEPYWRRLSRLSGYLLQRALAGFWVLGTSPFLCVCGKRRDEMLRVCHCLEQNLKLPYCHTLQSFPTPPTSAACLVLLYGNGEEDLFSLVLFSDKLNRCAPLFIRLLFRARTEFCILTHRLTGIRISADRSGFVWGTLMHDFWQTHSLIDRHQNNCWTHRSGLVCGGY